MTAGQSTGHVSSFPLAPAPLAALLGATLLAGALIGAATTAQLNSTDVNRGPDTAAGQPAATFDAVKFRAEERQMTIAVGESASVTQEQADKMKEARVGNAGTGYPQPTFDAVKFRAEERATPVQRTERNLISSRPGK
jgi:hypothetical protein